MLRFLNVVYAAGTDRGKYLLSRHEGIPRLTPMNHRSRDKLHRRPGQLQCVVCQNWHISLYESSCQDNLEPLPVCQEQSFGEGARGFDKEAVRGARRAVQLGAVHVWQHVHCQRVLFLINLISLISKIDLAAYHGKTSSLFSVCFAPSLFIQPFAVIPTRYEYNTTGSNPLVRKRRCRYSI